MDFKENILECIGETPLVKLNKIVEPNSATILVKCEFLNPSGSIKDRIAHYIIEQAEERGELKPGGVIVENTSGNTGLALAMVAAYKGYKCIFTMPDKMSLEKINMIKSFGAEVIVTPTDVPGDSPEHYVNTAKRIAKELPNAYYVDQYHSPDNIDAHYHNTAKEIWQQTGGKFDAFVAGTGTGGTISGVGRFIKEKTNDIQIVGVDPLGSIHYDYFYTKKLVEPKMYKVEGIGEDILCRALDFSVVDKMIQTNDQEAFLTARRLVREEGLFCGGSSGAIVHGALQVAKELGPNHTVVTVLTDSGSRYISKFLNDAWLKDHGFLTPHYALGTVKDLLAKHNHPVITVQASETVDTVIQKLKLHGISQLPVIDQNHRPIAMLHEVDILQKLQSGNIRYDSTAQEVAQPMGGLVTPNTPLSTLNHIFDKEQVAIVTDNDKLIAVISQIDMIDYMMSKLNEK
jgi:cystathionine beta-synthase